MGYVSSLPFVLVFSIVFLFYHLGVTFFSGIAVFTAAFAVNTLIGKLDAVVQERYLKRMDAR